MKHYENSDIIFFMECKICGKALVKNGIKNGVQYYYCTHCKKSYSGKDKTPSHHIVEEYIAQLVALHSTVGQNKTKLFCHRSTEKQGNIPLRTFHTKTGLFQKAACLIVFLLRRRKKLSSFSDTKNPEKIFGVFVQPFHGKSRGIQRGTFSL